MDLEAGGFSPHETSEASISESINQEEGCAFNMSEVDKDEDQAGNLINTDESKNDDDDLGDDDDFCDDDENDDYMYADDDDDDDDDDAYENADFLSLQARLENLNFPTGVEVSLPWLEGSTPTGKTPAASSSSTFPSLQAQSGVAKSSSVSAWLNAAEKDKDKEEDEMTRKFQIFKQFDTVEEFPDHHFNNVEFGGQPPKHWVKKIQEEWKLLGNDLPDTIYVRVCETRMDLLRSAIIGPAGTPYHDGLFFFDVVFPSAYPFVPPMVYYYAGGLRLNPNLYDSGKVCLSLLNTWNGKKTELWRPDKSTMLQVLVSIQALILNDKPFYNEPGHDTAYRGEEMDRRSKQYNEEAFILSLKTMMYAIRRPPKHFEDLVAGHFRDRAHDVLSACISYAHGAEIGSPVVEGYQDANDADKNVPLEFKANLGKMLKVLITSFVKNGSDDCEQFQLTAEKIIQDTKRFVGGAEMRTMEG